ncbi:hypothetical protein AB4Y64_11150 [Lysobacter sp. TAF61]|uniref:hypothetical protein n=1 Tax=Lysobacter sp. TAF61 TaxID=3233072 RepID=UPI003F95929C
MVIADPVAKMLLPAPTARTPIWPLAAAPMEVVASELPLNWMSPPVCANAPTELAAPRRTETPSAVITPPEPAALKPAAAAVDTVTVVPDATTHAVPFTWIGVGHATCA